MTPKEYADSIDEIVEDPIQYEYDRFGQLLYAKANPELLDAARALSRLLRELDRAVDGRISDKGSAERWAHNLARQKVLEIVMGEVE